MARTIENRDQARLALLVRAGEIFHRSLDVSATLDNVARLAVESFADICLFDLIDERSERLFVTASAHHDPSREEALAGVSNLLYVEEFGVHPVVRVTRTGKPFFVPKMNDSTLIEHAASRQHERYMREFGYRSKMVVPVMTQNHIFGALTFVRTRANDHFDQSDLSFALEFGRRAGLAVANAKQFYRERHVAETLQRAFLPNRFPQRDGLEISAYYRPGSTEADVGGDWYDAFENESGEIVITIGDVTGKGVEAARMMVLMRQAIRVAALSTSDPQEIVSICNRLLLSESTEHLASAFVGILSTDGRSLRYVSAGHVPPLVRLATREIVRLESPSPPLGAFANANFQTYEERFAEESMLVLYTDGLIEIARDVLAGERMLRRVLASEAIAHATNPAEFLERAIESLLPRDDIAIITVKFGRHERRWSFDATDARAAYTMRDEFLHGLALEYEVDGAALATCGLIFSELVGNTVRHAPGPISVSLERREGQALLHVIDKGPGFVYDPRLPFNLWSESGRGLFLVSKLATAVRVERIPAMGSHVIVTLPIRRNDLAAR